MSISLVRPTIAFLRLPSRTFVCAALVVFAAPLLSACRNGDLASPYTPASNQTRDPQRAQALTLQAVELIDKKPDQAERLLREALAADLFHGPAHNNLGVLCLRRNDLYAAASEFEFARKLLPGLPDPRMNLALTLEKAGRVDEALVAYSAALEVYPGHLHSMQGLARLQLARGKRDDRTAGMLDEIALRSESDDWKNWAKLQRIRVQR